MVPRIDVIPTEEVAERAMPGFQRFLPLFRLRPPPDRFRGTFAPARRASLRPIAIACFRLLTLRPERPDLRVPCLRSCIARFTLL